MKTFIISYLISLSTLVYIWLPDVMARPQHILPRIAFYLAFPLAIFLSAIFIFIASYIGIKSKTGQVEESTSAVSGQIDKTGQKRAA